VNPPRTHDKSVSERDLAAPVLTVEQALASLGSTAEQVADSLRPFAAGAAYINHNDCPIARYLRSLGFQDVVVAADYVRCGTTPHPLPWHTNWGAYTLCNPEAANEAVEQAVREAWKTWGAV
jgi:hypothetical protein